MPTQTRVPGAASSEVDFELERFERLGEDRLEIAGRWYGLRGRRFVRPVLNLSTGGGRRRAVALLEHKPWAAADGQTWLAAFTWPEGTGDIERAELEVGPGLIVALPAPGAVPAGGGRVSALRPHIPGEWSGRIEIAPPAPEVQPDGARGATSRRDGSGGRTGRDGHGAASGWIDRHGRGERDGGTKRSGGPPGAPRRDAINAAQTERDEALAARDRAEHERVQALNERDDALSRRDAALRDVDRALGEREEAEAERDRLQTELDRVTGERDHAHAERNRMMQDTEAVARDRDQAAAERDAARNELSRVVPVRDDAIRDRDAEATRADRAESERDTAYAERKSAVAQRDRARRERDRAMRAAGVEPPEESDVSARAETLAARAPAAAAVAAPGPAAPGSAAPARTAAPPGSDAPGPSSAPASRSGGGVAIPSRPLKRIGGASSGPAPEPKPLLTPVDGSQPRRLSRTRRAPSGAARWTVRVTAVVVLLAIALVVALLVATMV